MPILLNRLSTKSAKLIIAPRGMFQAGALSHKSLKKNIYIAIFKWLIPQKSTKWHATDQQEAQDIKNIFGINSSIQIIPNIPSVVKPLGKILKKEVGSIRIVSISLITAKKNLLLTLNALTALKGDIVFDIYGPIKDREYWKECELVIDRLNNEGIKVQHRGAIKHEDVQETIEQYHLFILPTKGENFGHAIFESFSVSRPVITSKLTPWVDLESKNAGWNIDIENADQLANTIKKAIELDQNSFQLLTSGAQEIAQEFWKSNRFKERYKTLFNS
ncbi:glycosyltransferase [Marinoscillum pacificum]|uniref:glycosyltransferase n=1 Tax=Marinoscillum pacificum TaxID=392723 RepID=UPI0021579163|nr:glycosyltransferase [Marinoscillum pacificum]